MTLAALTPKEREALLRELTELECSVTELRELAFVSIRRTFLPQGVHLDALSPSRLLILGERGVGKSALFRLLIEAQGAAALRLLFESPTLAATEYMEGFTETSMAHPPVTVVDDFALKVSGAAAVRAFWMAHLLRRLATMDLVELDDANRWLFDDSASAFAWMRLAPGQVAQLQSLMDGVERTLVREGRSICVLYDQLDRVGAHHPEVQRRAVGSLLSLWLSLAQRYRALRGKIFLRDDVFERTELDFPDVSKLRRGQSVTLRWSEGDLFRVALRHIVALCPRLGARLQELPALAASLRSVPDFGEIPGPMPDPMQREFLGALVGEVIGEGLLQTYSNRWLLGAILDSRRQATPRVMLSALGGAARAALESDSATSDARLLTEEELREGVRRAGLDRLRELRETHPVVRRMENIERRKVPVSAAVIDRWLGAPVDGEPSELAQLDGAAVRKLFLHLGLLSQPEARARCDVPDLYLYALRLSRVIKAGREEDRSVALSDLPKQRMIGIELSQNFFRIENEANHARRQNGEWELAPVLDAFKKAAQILEDYIAKARRPDPDVLDTLATMYYCLNDWLSAEESREHLRNVLLILEPFERHIHSASLSHMLGLLRHDLAFRSTEDAWDDLELAEQHFLLCINEDKSLPIPHLDMIRNLLSCLACRPTSLRLLDEAETMLKRAVNLLPQGDSGFEIFWLKRMSGSVHQAAALWAGQEDRLCAAQHEFKEAIRAEPYNHYGYVMHGNSLLLRALHEPMVDRRSTVAIAEGIFRRAQKLYFDHPGVVAGLARVALHRISWGQEPPSKLAKLEAQLKKAYEYDPSYASHPLACLYGLRGDRERRDFYLKRCQQLAQMLPLSWMSLEPGLADITAPT